MFHTGKIENLLLKVSSQVAASEIYQDRLFTQVSDVASHEQNSDEVFVNYIRS
jgi:hypothetical protein